MVGSFLTRGLVLIFGYAYPAYECYKTVELNRPEIEQLIFWCQYWILVAAVTVLERLGDAFVSWIPMYNEAKLALFVYLWYPKTKGTKYIYETFFRPYIAKHENEIDRSLQELRARAGDIAVFHWEKVASFVQTTTYQILQYIASQSPSQSSRSRPVQRQQQQQTSRTSSVTKQQPVVPQQPSNPKIHRQQSTNTSPPERPIQAQEPTKSGAPTPPASPKPPPVSTALATVPGEGEMLKNVDVANGIDKEDPIPSLQETPVEDAIRVMRSRLRKRVAPSSG
ncbi:putative HVA22-like protein g isoform X2 [Ananas comosus]|uniref:HVA22-like protein n=1 Tax=Ananas comosus TaxID=4615 RepID=A0A199VBZ6_ANACO|nr:putative HVA22-like protein g isoform X2 [Ananas comosus]OAY74637.1 HVA22-like protein i [Ananas comosus]